MKFFFRLVTSWYYVLLFMLLVTIQGYTLVGRKRNENGEIIGIQGRGGWKMKAPVGMVFIPRGSFIMGPVDEDVSGRISLNKQVSISSFYMDETEITNNQYRQFIQIMENVDSQVSQKVIEAIIKEQYPEGVVDKTESEIRELILQQLYPDMTVWKRDFVHHMGDPMLEQYFQHAAFKDYPVVGVTWNAARYFMWCRTEYLNQYRREKGLEDMPSFRLPTAAEWEYAARGGKDLVKYPWGGGSVRDEKGRMLANFKANRGSYTEGGSGYTTNVKTFLPNGYGLYDMAGNVAEWCLDAYHPAAVVRIGESNPCYQDDNQPLKVVMGGSWKDISAFLQTGVRDYAHKDSAASYIGFRGVIPHIGDE